MCRRVCRHVAHARHGRFQQQRRASVHWVMEFSLRIRHSHDAKVMTLVVEDGLVNGLTDLNVTEYAQAFSGNRIAFFTYDSREHAVTAWNGLRFWWFHVPLPGKQRSRRMQFPEDIGDSISRSIIHIYHVAEHTNNWKYICNVSFRVLLN